MITPGIGTFEFTSNPKQCKEIYAEVWRVNQDVEW